MRRNGKQLVFAGSLIAAGLVTVFAWRSMASSHSEAEAEAVPIAAEDPLPETPIDETEPESKSSAWIKLEEDGSRMIFDQSEDKRSLIKTTRTTEGAVEVTAIYRLDAKGNPLKCDLYDELGESICKVRFGYSKRPGITYGKLVQELFYDTRQKRLVPDGQSEQPVHMFLHRYKGDGSAERPTGITLIEDKTLEDLLGRPFGSQALPDFDKLEKVNDLALLNPEPVEPGH